MRPSRLWSVLTFALALVAGLVLGTSRARAAHPDPAARELEVPIRDFSTPEVRNPQTDAARLDVERALQQRFAGEWRVHAWNPQTGTARSFYGSGADVSARFESANEAVGVARGLVHQNPTVFGARVADLRTLDSAEGLGKRSVVFQQTYHGIDVWGGRVRLLFTEEGRFFLGGSDFYDGITIDWRPTIQKEEAAEIAQHALPFDPTTDRMEHGSKLLVLPVATDPFSVTHHLVWRVTVRTQQPLGKWVTHVDAHTGEIVWRYNDIHFANFTGSASGDVREGTYCNTNETQPLRHLRVQVAGLGSTTTDLNGNWTLVYAGVDARTVTADLYGPYVDLNNIGAGPEGAFSASATPGVPLAITLTDANSRKDERDVFQAVSDIHDFFQQIDPGFAYANQRITANVNRSDGFCPGNAWWDGTINFCAASATYANTGEIQGVVHHEFGHGVQNAILGFQGNEGLGEGNGDILANLLTQESHIGRGFFVGNCTTGIRNSDNVLQYPGDVVGQEEHSAGRVIAGFHWDAMELLQQLHGAEAGTQIAAELWHFGRKLNLPTDQSDQVLATFGADDDNGDLSDGTPNFDALCFAAMSHGFTCPTVTTGISITHTPLATSTVEGDKVVDAVIVSTGSALDPAELYVDWREGDEPYQRIAMTNPAGDNWTATIPSVLQPSEIDYYIHAGDVGGAERTNPLFAPTYFHSFDVALVHDTQEAANAWIVNPDANDTATTGAWVRVDPNGTAAQPENDHTPAPGTVCWVTGNAPAGQGDGTADVDGGVTTLQSVAYDLTGAATATVKYFRWFSNDAGASPGLDPWVVQIRNNGGAWQQIENTLASGAGWLEVSDDVVARFGAGLGMIELRFIARDEGPGSLIEAAVDDLEILAQLLDPASADEPLPGAPLRFALGAATPNPSRSGVTIGFQVPVASDVELTIYDVHGRAVRTLIDGAVAPGTHATTWDGRDAAGRLVNAGAYFYRFRGGAGVLSRKLLVVR